MTLNDFEQSDCILIVGQNPGTNHPRMLTSLEHAKKHGAKIIAINPLAEPGFLRFNDPNPDEYPNADPASPPTCSDRATRSPTSISPYGSTATSPCSRGS